MRQFSSGLGHEYRLYRDTPLNDVGTDCADIYSDFLFYKHGTISTAQEIIEKYSCQLGSVNIADMRRSLKAIRTEQSADAYIEKCNFIIERLGYYEFEEESQAVRTIWNNESLEQLFKPVAENEVQLMTLHKSKGLEFKIVIHIDLEEWSFPHRIPGADWDEINYPSLEEDTNLHYVGITRAELVCILIRTSLRLNASGEYGNSRPSYFLNLPQLEGLYR